MARFLGSRSFFLMMVFVSIYAQDKPSIRDLHSECLGNILRLSMSLPWGNHLEVEAVMNGTEVIPLTPSMASQCGYSLKVDPMGNAMIFASLQNCFAQNMDDKTFSLATQLRLQGNHMTEDTVFGVAKTCTYTSWASREIICERNYMEVSVRRILREPSTVGPNAKPGHGRRATDPQATNSGYKMESVSFHTPGGVRNMKVDEVHRRGYGMSNTLSRLVLRCPHHAPETYSMQVAGISMKVLKTSTFYVQKWLSTRVDADAVCPTPSGDVNYTPDMISWFMPKHINPLVSSDDFTILEMHMGIDGKRMDPAEMAARQYSMTVTDLHIVIKIPVGAVGGYFKSLVHEDQYYVTYCIEPMLELLWLEDDAHEDTRYKVLLPITTPPMSRPPQVTDHTVHKEKVFRVQLRICSDVDLVNITFSNEVLSVAECNARRFKVQEHGSQNGTKTITLQVPFSDPVVLQRKGRGVLVYTLHLIFGLLVVPEYSPFAHPAVLEAVLQDIVPPSVIGSCDHENFYISIKYGTQAFQTKVGKRWLTHELNHDYGLIENATHFTITVPFSAPDAVFEMIESSSIRSRLDVALRDTVNNVNLNDLSMSCSFQSTLTECFTNGTMTVLAVKVESVPGLNPSQLTLRDPACVPAYSDDRFAFFRFTVSSCGTTRKFLDHFMLYENEVSLPDEQEVKTGSKTPEQEEAEYQLKVSCFYVVNTTQTVAFLTGPRNKEPFAEPAKGQLVVIMRLFQDNSYSIVQEDYPVVKYLRQPLYFEVELMRSSDPKVELVLEHCWATLHEDRSSQPRWNLIINGCGNPEDPQQIVFHPVEANARVHHPSHFKRFEVQMFSFATDQDNLSGQVFVHCDVIICDANSPMGSPCSGQCVNQGNTKGQRRAVSDTFHSKQVSVGPIYYIVDVLQSDVNLNKNVP